MPEEIARPCPDCGYDMRGLPVPHRCPECGVLVDLRQTIWRPSLKSLLSIMYFSRFTVHLLAITLFGAIAQPQTRPFVLPALAVIFAMAGLIFAWYRRRVQIEFGPNGLHVRHAFYEELIPWRRDPWLKRRDFPPSHTTRWQLMLRAPESQCLLPPILYSDADVREFHHSLVLGRHRWGAGRVGHESTAAALNTEAPRTQARRLATEYSPPSPAQIINRLNLETTSLSNCPLCGFNLTGHPAASVCPGCGVSYDEKTRVWRPAARWLGNLIAVSLTIAALIAGIGPQFATHASRGEARERDGWRYAIPLFLLAFAIAGFERWRRSSRVVVAARTGVQFQSDVGRVAIPWRDILGATRKGAIVTLTGPDPAPVISGVFASEHEAERFVEFVNAVLNQRHRHGES